MRLLRFKRDFLFIVSDNIINGISIVDMNLKDFKGMFKYKLIVPTLFIISWVLMFVGSTLIFQD